MAKYVALKSNQYWYQRAWPSSVRGYVQTAKFRLAIGVDRNAPDHEIAKAAAIAEQAYHLECERISNSSATAVEDAVLDKLSDRALKDLGKSPGALSNKKLKTAKRPRGMFKVEQVKRISFPEGIEISGGDDEALQAMLDRGVDYDSRTDEISVTDLNDLSPEQILERGQAIAIAALLTQLPEKDALDKQ